MRTMSTTVAGTRKSRRSRPLPDLQLLEAFVAVCDSGSMALAARQLGLSQSAISQAVKALEAEMGIPLLDREVRPAVATHAGRVLRERATRLLGQAHSLVDQVRASARHEHTQIHLGCVDSFAATVGPRLIRALSGSAQQILMWSGLTPTLTEQLRGRELDFAICTDSAVDDPRIVQRMQQIMPSLDPAKVSITYGPAGCAASAQVARETCDTVTVAIAPGLKVDAIIPFVNFGFDMPAFATTKPREAMDSSMCAAT